MKTMKKLLALFCCAFLMCMSARSADELVGFHLSSANGLPDNDIRYMEQDATGYIYLLSLYAAYQYDGYSFRRLPESEFNRLKAASKKRFYGPDGSFADNRGNHVGVTSDGYIHWRNARDGNSVSIKVFDQKTLAASTDLKLRVIADREERLWVSTNGNGLFLYNLKTKQLRHYSENTDKDLVSNDFIVFMMADRDGNIWISTEHYGLHCLRVENRRYGIVDANGTADNRNNVRLLRRLADGTLIVADNYGSLFRSADELKTLTPMPALSETYIDACLDSRGRLWLGTRKRGVRIGNRFYGEGRVDCIISDHRGRMWMCGLRRPLTLARLSANGEYSEKHYINNVKNLDPRVLMQDHRGRIWMGTAKGLYVFHPDSLVARRDAYTLVSRLPVRSLLEDSRHRLWVGTEGHGVLVGECGRPVSHFKRLSSASGFPNDVIQFVVEDSKHNICVGTEDGCVYLKDGNLAYTLFFPNNLARNFFNERSGVRLRDGRMAFATMDCIVVADADIYTSHAPLHGAAFTGMSINGVSVYQMGSDGPVAHDMSRMGEITLAHNQNTFDVNFSAFDFESRHHTLFAYRLEGYDDTWSLPTVWNFASYKNLPPGKYTLRLKYKQAGDAWRECPQRLEIKVSPPWWLSWWALSLYGLALAAVGYAVYRQLHTTYRLRQRIQVEKQLTEFKLRFFTNISHEFRTPLTLIQGAMERLEHVPAMPAAARLPMSNMEHSVDRMRRLVNQLLEFRKLQRGKLSLALQPTEVVAFLDGIFMNFHEAAENKHISYQFLPQEKKITAYVDRNHVDKMVYNLLSNALKYTPERGAVTLKVERGDGGGMHGGSLVIEVADTGIGVDKEKQAHLFDRYATGKVSPDSIGIGLNLTQELVKVHHGTIAYRDNPGGGSVFTVTLPTDKEAYAADDFMQVHPELSEGGEEGRRGFRTSYLEVSPEPMNGRSVLVVDDDADICQMLKTELGKYFVVGTAGNGAEALERMNDGGTVPDLLVTDVMMPVMDGYELVKKVRADKRLRHIPVIMLTALQDTRSETQGLDAGADAYLVKPFSMALLVAQIANLIKQRDVLRNAYAQAPRQKDTVKAVIRSEKDKKFVEQLDSFVSSRLADTSLSVDALAHAFGVGRTTISTRVRELTGKSPAEYIKDVRLRRAAELLRGGNVTINEVAYQVGFSTPQYLSVAFKQKFGVSPKKYQAGE